MLPSLAPSECREFQRRPLRGGDDARPCRGRGQRIAEQLMQAIEQYSRERQYRLLVVDTFSFQAPEFYKKVGYEESNVVDGWPRGHRRHFFRKRLESPAP